MMSRSPRPLLRLVALAALAFAPLGNAVAAPVTAAQQKDRSEARPERLQQVDVKEQLGSSLPTELQFISSEGQAQKLADLLPTDKPLLLTFNYSDCPMLCSLQLNGLVDGLRKVDDRRLGKDYELLTVSLDPKEDPQRLSAMKDRYVSQYLLGAKDDPKSVRDSWHFVRGDAASIGALAKAVGFSYNYNEARDEYLHPAAVMLINPSGKVARYLYGIEYHPRTLSLSVVEVSEGKVGGSMEQLILYCFHYDESEGRYAPVAMNIMRVGGSDTALALGGVLAGFFAREKRKKNQKKEGDLATR
jgi:protein SCO1/2